MFVASIIIALVFAVLIIISPFIFKAIFKLGDFMGYCIGFCSSVLSFFIEDILIVVGFAGFAAVLTKDFEGKNGSYTIREAFEIASVGSLLVLLAVYLVSEIITFIILISYTKRVSTQEFGYSSIFMFISGYSTFFIGGNLLAMAILSAVSLDFINVFPTNAKHNDAWNNFLLFFDFFLFGYFLRLAGVAILFMIYYRGAAGKLPAFIAVGILFGPIIFFLIGIITKVIEIIEYPGFAFDISSVVVAIIFYLKNAAQVTQVNGALLTNSGMELQAPAY